MEGGVPGRGNVMWGYFDVRRSIVHLRRFKGPVWMNMLILESRCFQVTKDTVLRAVGRSLKCSKQGHDLIRFVFKAHSNCTFGVFILFLSLSLDCKNQGSVIYW